MSTAEVQTRVREIEPELVAIRREIHQHPELTFELDRTPALSPTAWQHRAGRSSPTLAGKAWSAFCTAAAPARCWLFVLTWTLCRSPIGKQVPYASTDPRRDARVRSRRPHSHRDRHCRDPREHARSVPRNGQAALRSGRGSRRRVGGAGHASLRSQSLARSRGAGESKSGRLDGLPQTCRRYRSDRCGCVPGSSSPDTTLFQ